MDILDILFCEYVTVSNQLECTLSDMLEWTHFIQEEDNISLRVMDNVSLQFNQDSQLLKTKEKLKHFVSKLRWLYNKKETLRIYDLVENSSVVEFLSSPDIRSALSACKSKEIIPGRFHEPKMGDTILKISTLQVRIGKYSSSLEYMLTSIFPNLQWSEDEGIKLHNNVILEGVTFEDYKNFSYSIATIQRAYLDDNFTTVLEEIDLAQIIIPLVYKDDYSALYKSCQELRNIIECDKDTYNKILNIPMPGILYIFIA